MHSKIIQLSDTPVVEPIKASDFSEGFVGWIADYTADMDLLSQQKVIDSFLGDIKSEYSDLVDIGERLITFKEGFHKKYEENTMTKLQDIMSKDVDFTSRRWRIKVLLNDEFGLYICWDSLYTLQSFLSNEFLDGMTFYVGAVVDYHF